MVYVSANSIPSYTIGPKWTGNPNNPSAQGDTWSFYRTPTANTGTLTTGSLGTIGLWKNGMSIYNADDGQYYVNTATGVNTTTAWSRNAYFFEYSSFDGCFGHASAGGRYHNHVLPVSGSKCMFTLSTTTHSPIVGFMFDSYPIYGPFGYSSANSSTSGVKRMTSSYVTRNITARTSLTDGGTTLATAYQGPAIDSTTYPLGAFIADYKYSAGYGDLDANNGRWCVTPEYPSGTYAYFTTTTSTGSNAYPYTLGKSYYGMVNMANTGPSSSVSKQTVATGATKYF